MKRTGAAGHDWQAPIEKASATVTLPSALPKAEVETAGYTGRFGSRRQDVEIHHGTDGRLYFEATRPFGPLEGLTVVAAWPHGHVAFPGPVGRATRFLFDNWILSVPLAVLGGLIWQYRRRGLDPVGRGSVVVQYEPPKGVSPGIVGTLIDEKVDLRDITATVVDLAVRGHLVIEVTERQHFLGLLTSEQTYFERKTSRNDDDLLPHERLILTHLFNGQDRVATSDLKNEFYKKLPLSILAC